MIKRFYDADKVDEMLRNWQVKLVLAMDKELDEPTDEHTARSYANAYGTVEILREKLPDTMVKIRIKD